MGLTSSTQATGFNPRTPCGVRHAGSPHPLARSVSIHALLAECDRRPAETVSFQQGFNPRTPCGVRHHASGFWRVPLRFQSTHSLRSATTTAQPALAEYGVSIHALLAECDMNLTRQPRRQKGFNPRTPCGVRRHGGVRAVYKLKFQSTHSLRSATLPRRLPSAVPAVSIHALLAECDIQTLVSHLPTTRFQSTHSLRSATAFLEVI